MASQPSLAQSITPDGTLGAEASQVVPVGAVTDRIEAGAIRGSNLFHSFEAFSIDAGREVYFSNPTGVTNIFSRVTGTEGSEILGTLGVEGDASLYLLNPHGIVFGPNAQLDINGTFIGSTAGQFTLGDSLAFSASAPQAAPILNVSVEPGLQLGNATTGTIVVEGDLRVGQDLKLEANQVEIEGKISTQGNISIIATDSVLMNEGEVTTVLASDGLGKAGDIYINTRHFKAENRSLIASTSESEIKTERLNEQGTGDLRIIATDSFLLDGKIQGDGSIESNDRSQILTNQKAESFGFAGDIYIESDAFEVTHYSQILSKHEGEGGAGNITLEAGNSGIIRVINGSSVQSRTEPIGIGDSGDILLNAARIDVAHGTIYVGSLPEDQDPGRGDAGKVTLNASEEVNLSASVTPGFSRGTWIGSQMYGRGSSTEGIEINTKRFKMSQRSFLFSLADGIFPEAKGAGDIKVNATERFTIDNSEIISDQGDNSIGNAGKLSIFSPRIEARNGSRITSQSQGYGNGGQLSLQTNGGSIELINNVLLASNIGEEGVGRAGDIFIEARDILIIGPDTTIESINQSKSDSSRGGDIEIMAEGTLEMRGGVRILSSLGQSEFRRTNSDWSRDNNGEPIDFGLGSRGQAGDISIKVSLLKMDDSSLEASTFGLGDAGSINISAVDSIVITNSLDAVSSKVGIDSTGKVASGKAGDISISTPSLELLNGSRIISSTQGNGAAGNILVSVSGKATIRGEVDANTFNQKLSGILAGLTPEEKTQVQQGQISKDLLAKLTFSGEINTILNAEACASQACSSGLYSAAEQTSQGNDGQGGTISVLADELTLSGKARIDASTSSTRPAGSINLTTNRLDINDAQVSSSTTAEGAGGAIQIAATAAAIDIALQNDGEITAATSSSGRSGDLNLFATDSITISGKGTLSAETSGQGSAGNISIATNRFTLDEGTKLTNTATQAARPPANTDVPSANININANEMNLFGEVQILSDTQGSAQAGSLTLQPNGSDDLNINLRKQSRVSASTSGSGSGGSLLLSAPNHLRISGDGTLSAESRGSGSAGQVQVQAQRFTLEDGATLSTSTSGSGQGGNLKINVSDVVTLNNGARLVAQSTKESSNRGGNINLDVGTAVLLSNQSLIETDAEGRGDGGNITLVTPFLFGFENSDIIANARSGDGGKVNITANNIFNFQIQDGQNREQLQENSNNEVSASSETGTSGIISLNTPNVDPAGSLAELPSNLIDASNLIDRGLCAVGNTSEFVVTARGGLPSSPNDTLTATSGWEDWNLAELESHPRASQAQHSLKTVVALSSEQDHPPSPAIEAKYWGKAFNGNVVLYSTAQAAIQMRSPQCRQLQQQLNSNEATVKQP